MCGFTLDTDGYVCCRDQSGLPRPFTPSPVQWYYRDENSTVEPLPMRVFLWPGYGSEEDDPKEDIFPTEPFTGAPYAAPGGCFHPICPRGSVCIPFYECPYRSIHYIKDMASTRLKFLCGISLGTEGWLCCSLHFIKNALSLVRQAPCHPAMDDHELLMKINFDVQKSKPHYGADVSHYSRVSYGAVPPSPQQQTLQLPDYYEEDFANDVEEYLQKREEQDPHIQRHKRDTNSTYDQEDEMKR